MEIALGHINVDNVCANISIEYGTKFAMQGPRMESFVLR